jgi:hypothetical protein
MALGRQVLAGGGCPIRVETGEAQDVLRRGHGHGRAAEDTLQCQGVEGEERDDPHAGRAETLGVRTAAWCLGRLSPNSRGAHVGRPIAVS